MLLSRKNNSSIKNGAHILVRVLGQWENNFIVSTKGYHTPGVESSKLAVLRQKCRGWRDYSTVKTTGCFFKRPGISSIHMVTYSVCNFSFRGSDILFWPLWAMHRHTCIQNTNTDKNKHFFKKIKLSKELPRYDCMTWAWSPEPT